MEIGEGMSINRRAQKHGFAVEDLVKSLEITSFDISHDNAEWQEYMAVEHPRQHGRTRERRMFQRLIDGRAIKPCGRECREWGYAIISTYEHKSMKNSKELVNDKEFLIEAMKITPNPRECNHFFYVYVNEYLKKDAGFRLDMLRALFMNVYILGRSDIEWFVERYGFQHEYDIIKADKSFQQYLQNEFQPTLDIPDKIKKWNNIDEKKEYRRYRKTLTEIHNDNQARFNDQQNCFDKEEEIDPVEAFFNSEFIVE